MKKQFFAYLQSPLGAVEISGTETFVTSVNFVMETAENSENLPEVILQCVNELNEYFAGKRKEFSIKTKTEGTLFQKKIWKELLKIKFGDTSTYLTVSKKIGNEKAVRAVGRANGKNPIAIIIPCHRVISEDGKLTGYAGGMWRKQWLLDMEGNISGKNLSLF